MRYQHTNTSHNRSSGFSSVAEIAGGMGLRSPQPQQLPLSIKIGAVWPCLAAWPGFGHQVG